MATWTQRSGLDVERTDDAILVRDVDAGIVHALTGEEAAAFEWADRGQDPAPAHLQDALAALVELRLVTSDGWNRRRVLIRAAAVVAGVAAVAGVRAVSRLDAGSPAEASSKPTTPPAPTTLDLTYRLVAGGAGVHRTGRQSAVGIGFYPVAVVAASGTERASSRIDLPTPVSATGGATGGAEDSGAVASGAGGSGYDLSGAGGSGYNLSGAGGSGYNLSGAGGTGTEEPGGHGMVVISYPTPRSGVTGKGGIVSTSGGTTYHRFDRSGTFTIG